MIERIEDFINMILGEVADESRAEYADILYGEYMESMYGNDPRWNGPDYDA